MKKVIFYKKDIGYGVQNPNESFGDSLGIFVLMFDGTDIPFIKEYVEKHNSGVTSGDRIYVDFNEDIIIVGDDLFPEDIDIEKRIQMKRDDFLNLANFWQSLKNLKVKEIELRVDSKKVYVLSENLYFEAEYSLQLIEL